MIRDKFKELEAQAAKMRAKLMTWIGNDCDCLSCQSGRHALSSEAGKGWLSPEEVQELRGEVQVLRNALQVLVTAVETSGAIGYCPDVVSLFKAKHDAKMVLNGERVKGDV